MHKQMIEVEVPEGWELDPTKLVFNKHSSYHSDKTGVNIIEVPIRKKLLVEEGCYYSLAKQEYLRDFIACWEFSLEQGNQQVTASMIPGYKEWCVKNGLDPSCSAEHLLKELRREGESVMGLMEMLQEDESRAFGSSWCGPDAYEGGAVGPLGRLVAKYYSRDDDDGQTVEVYREAVLPVFYTIRALPGVNSVGNAIEPWEFATGSSQLKLTADIAKAVSEGMLAPKMFGLKKNW